MNLAYDYVITSSAGPVTRRDPNARVVTSETGHAITYDPAAYVWQTKTFTPPALNKLAIYVIDVGQFAPGPSGWGTFQSAIAQLGHISGMGFTAVELLPVTQANGVHANPYGPTDQYAIDNLELGGPDNLKAFVDACHQSGLAVIFDAVHNHWGPYNLADFDFDGWQTSTAPGGIYFYASSGADPYGSPYGPRPNYSNPIVQSYILGQIGMWFNEYRADGLRWDSISNIYNAWSGGVGKRSQHGQARRRPARWSQAAAKREHHLAAHLQNRRGSFLQQSPIPRHAADREWWLRLRFTVECDLRLLCAQRLPDQPDHSVRRSFRHDVNLQQRLSAERRLRGIAR